MKNLYYNQNDMETLTIPNIDDEDDDNDEDDGCENKVDEISSKISIFIARMIDYAS